MSDPVQSLQDVAYRYRFGPAVFDEARFELTVDGQRVALERRPLEVLAMLLHHAGEVVTKEELLETVWTGRITVENVLANAVAKLRKGLGKAGAARLLTQARIGYRLEGPVERVAVGRRFANRLRLAAGQPVPQRENFTLERQLAGTSGSEVWLARHNKTGERRVYKFSPDGERLSLLKREATLFRVLREGLGDRADLVRIIDWNFESPPFFLECEYGGENLAEWAGQDGRLAGLAFEDRLDLALQAVGAVAAAHEAGVLHKDIKPSNVLVSARREGGWQVKVADFGAGALLDRGRLQALGITPLGLTRDGSESGSSSLGTPLFMAPELIAGEAPTARSDVYSLGILVYQILAGDVRKLMTSGWERDISCRLLREDLAAAASGDPAHRLASASLFADRLQSLEARRAALADREAAERAAAGAHREVERLRARRPWIAATLAVLAAGLATSLWLAGQANEARHRAQAEAARAEATGAFLSDLLVNANPHEPGGSGAVTVREALDRAAGGIADRFAGDPRTEAAIRLKAADIYAALADYGGAAGHRGRAASLFEDMYGARDRRTLEVRFGHALALVNASHYDEAADVLAAAEAGASALLEDDPALVFAAAQARGRIHLLRAEIEPAAAALEEALRAGALAAPDDAVIPFRLRMDLSQCYSRLGRHDEAVAMLEDLQDPRHAEGGVSAASQASAALYYGAALLYAARYEAAEPALKGAIQALAAVFGEDSAQVAEAYGALGNLYATTGRWEEAQPVIAAVRERMCSLHGEAHLTCMMARGNEGVVAFQRGRAAEAVATIGPARDAFELALGAASPGVHVLGYYLAMAELDAGEVDDADRHSRSLDPASLESGSPGEQWAARVDGLRARILMAKGDCGAGTTRLKAAITALETGGSQEWILAPYREAALRACP